MQRHVSHGKWWRTLNRSQIGPAAASNSKSSTSRGAERMFRMPKDVNIAGKQYKNHKQNKHFPTFDIIMSTLSLLFDPPYRKAYSDRRLWHMNRGMRRISGETTRSRIDFRLPRSGCQTAGRQNNIAFREYHLYKIFTVKYPRFAISGRGFTARYQ